MPHDRDDRLQALADDYTVAVNQAIEEDRFDLVERLADEYPDAVLAVLSAG